MRVLVYSIVGRVVTKTQITICQRNSASQSVAELRFRSHLWLKFYGSKYFKLSHVLRFLRPLIQLSCARLIRVQLSYRRIDPRPTPLLFIAQFGFRLLLALLRAMPTKRRAAHEPLYIAPPTWVIPWPAKITIPWPTKLDIIQRGPVVNSFIPWPTQLAGPRPVKIPRPSFLPCWVSMGPASRKARRKPRASRQNRQVE